MAWEFQREEQQFEVLPEGKYRVRVRLAEKATSKKGNDMLVLQFDVSGHSQILYHYIVFLEDRPQITNRMLTSFFDSFKDIPEGDFNLEHWVGKVGACMVKHDEYNGSPSAKISYFIKANKQDDLPAWVEPDEALGTTTDNEFMSVPEDVNDLPFV